MARFQQVNAPAQKGQSETSNYYDYLAEQARLQAELVAIGERGKKSGLSKLKSENASLVKTILDTHELYLELYTNQWKNRQIDGATFDKKVSELTYGVDDGTGHHPGLLDKIDILLGEDNLDNLNDSTITKLQTKGNDIAEAIRGNEKSFSSPYYLLNTRIEQPESFADFQDPNNATNLYRSTAPGNLGQFVNMGGIWVKLDGTKMVPDFAPTPNETHRRYIIDVQDPDNPDVPGAKKVFYDPNNQKHPYLTIDPKKLDSKDGLSPTVVPWDPTGYTVVSKKASLIHDTQGGAYYKIDSKTMKKTLVSDLDGYTPQDHLLAREVNESTLKGFPDYTNPILDVKGDSGSVPPPPGSLMSMENPEVLQQRRNPILDVSPRFMEQRNPSPKMSRVGAPKSQFSNSFGGGGSF